MTKCRFLFWVSLRPREVFGRLPSPGFCSKNLVFSLPPPLVCMLLTFSIMVRAATTPASDLLCCLQCIQRPLYFEQAESTPSLSFFSFIPPPRLANTRRTRTLFGLLLKHSRMIVPFNVGRAYTATGLFAWSVHRLGSLDWREPKIPVAKNRNVLSLPSGLISARPVSS